MKKFIKEGGLHLIFWVGLFLVAGALDGCVATIVRGMRIAASPNCWDHKLPQCNHHD